jgi:hypothetical protein
LPSSSSSRQHPLEKKAAIVVVAFLFFSITPLSKEGDNSCCRLLFLYKTPLVATLALGSRPRQRGCKVAGQEGSPRVTSHVPRSAMSVKE